jgi:hypothetical protein
LKKIIRPRETGEANNVSMMEGARAPSTFLALSRFGWSPFPASRGRISKNHWSAARLLKTARLKTRCFIGIISNAFDLPETATINAANLAR